MNRRQIILTALVSFFIPKIVVADGSKEKPYPYFNTDWSILKEGDWLIQDNEFLIEVDQYVPNQDPQMIIVKSMEIIK